MQLPIKVDSKGNLTEPITHDEWLEQISWRDECCMTFRSHWTKEFMIRIPEVQMVVATEFRVHNIIFDFLFFKLDGVFIRDESELKSEITGACASVQSELLRYYKDLRSVIILTGSYGGPIFITGGFREGDITYSPAP